MQVVQDQDHRRLLHGEARHHPVETVTHPGRVRHVAARHRDQTQRGGDDVVPAAQEGAEFLLVQRCQHRLDELAHHVERQLLFLLAAPARQHGEPLRRRADPGLGQQGGLAHTGRTGEGEQTPARRLGHAVDGVAQPRQGRVERPELLAALEQRPGLGQGLPQLIRHVPYRFLSSAIGRQRERTPPDGCLDRIPERARQRRVNGLLLRCGALNRRVSWPELGPSCLPAAAVAGLPHRRTGAVPASA